MRTREQHNEWRRKQILQIALDEFIAKGYHGASTREICKKADVSSGLMFHYFDSKQTLYEALIEIGCEGMTLECEHEDSPIQSLGRMLSETLLMITTQPFAARMFVFMGSATYNAAQISPRAGEMLALHDITRQSIPLIEKGQSLGEIRRGDAHALSVAFWCSIQGIAEAIALAPETPCPDAEWVLDILRNREGSQ